MVLIMKINDYGIWTSISIWHKSDNKLDCFHNSWKRGIVNDDTVKALYLHRIIVDYSMHYYQHGVGHLSKKDIRSWMKNETF